MTTLVGTAKCEQSDGHGVDISHVHGLVGGGLATITCNDHIRLKDITPNMEPISNTQNMNITKPSEMECDVCNMRKKSILQGVHKPSNTPGNNVGCVGNIMEPVCVQCTHKLDLSLASTSAVDKPKQPESIVR